MDVLPNHIHFLGIAGIGVSALAQLALARGVRVSGSDPYADAVTNPAIARLLAGGATIFTRHSEENLTEDVQLVVVSAAVPESNPEVQAARRHGVRIVSRAEFLGELMAAHPGPKIAVAGTHGKTTTTAMIGVMLQHAGLDPTVFVGGEVPQLGGNVRIGGPTGPFVAEACEAYDSFLYLKPDIAIVTNIEADHLDHYGTLEGVLESFRRFLNHVLSGGTVIFHAEDANIATVLGRMEQARLRVPYDIEGLSSPGDHRDAGARALDIRLEPNASFLWRSVPGELVPIRLQVPGYHNVLKSLAAATVGYVLDIPKARIAAGLEAFRGVGRRQEILAEIAIDAETVLVMDDYAHHPTEIRATLDALRAAYPNRRLVSVFQPHLYSRTRDFLAEFASTLAAADVLVVTDVYAAREAPIPGVRASDIVALASEQVAALQAIYLPDQRDIPDALRVRVRPGDLVVFLGAGDIREQAERFTELMRREQIPQLPAQDTRLQPEAVDPILDSLSSGSVDSESMVPKETAR